MGVIKWIINEMKSYKLLAYEEEYSDEAKEIAEETQGIMSGETHSLLSEHDFKEYYDSKESLIKWYFNYIGNVNKIEAIGDVGIVVKKKGAHNVLSLGCGPAVLEYFLKLACGDEINVYASDYDSYLITNSERVLKTEGLHFLKYDFYKDSVRTLIEEYDIDMVIMFGSSCSMDNKKYNEFLKDLHGFNLSIITFEAGVVSNMYMLKFFLSRIIDSVRRYNNGKEKLIARHAWIRRVGEVTSIYKKAGWRYSKINNKYYEYAYLLED